MTALGCGNLVLSAEDGLGRLPERSLAFHSLHTGENLNCVYWVKGKYIPEALAEINWILRDYRRNKIKPIDTRLLDVLCALHRILDTREPFHVVCGYRSPATNDFLREHNDGVAKHSLHMLGMATDIRVPGRDIEAVRNAAMAFGGGGVGAYPRSQFVHVDVGRVRYWRLSKGILLPANPRFVENMQPLS